jgi:hypothetical protein
LVIESDAAGKPSTGSTAHAVTVTSFARGWLGSSAGEAVCPALPDGAALAAVLGLVSVLELSSSELPHAVSASAPIQNRARMPLRMVVSSFRSTGVETVRMLLGVGTVGSLWAG